MQTVTLDNGKYKIVNDNGVVKAYRHGEEWRDLTGDGLILALLNKVETLEDKARYKEDVAEAASDIAKERHNTPYSSEKYIMDLGDSFEIERYDDGWDYSSGTSSFYVTYEEARARVDKGECNE